MAYAAAMSVDLGLLYASSRWRLTDLLETMDHAVGEVPCPATPGWCVHDVVAHLRGVTEDVRTGNLDGVATEPWTAAQVERYRNDSLATLLDDWATDAVPFEEFLSGPHGQGGARAVLDVHTHEIDVLGAVGVRHPLPEEFGEWVMPLVTSGLIEGSAGAGLTPIRVVTDEGDVLGAGDAMVTLRVGRFELFRGVTGRRSPEQVDKWDWGGADATLYLAHFFILGPRLDDLVE
jgi:uncharacterized protein (TIGR03083 family)